MCLLPVQFLEPVLTDLELFFQFVKPLLELFLHEFYLLPDKKKRQKQVEQQYGVIQPAYLAITVAYRAHPLPDLLAAWLGWPF